jgi:hypothetical protein
MQIFKYPINIGEFITEMPKDATFLCAQTQEGKAKMWFAVDPRKETCKRKFQIVGTGHEFDMSDKNYLATFQEPGFVWHLFECVHAMPAIERQA